MQALLAKSLDIITTSATVFLHGFVEGADVKIVGGVNNRFPYTFFTRPNITTPAQLKGKVIGITRYGSTDELATRMALEQFGLNAKNDVKFIQGGGSAGRINALQAGSIDGTSLISGVSHVARKAGMNPMLDFAEKEIDYQMTGVVARGDYLKSNPDALRRFLRAYVESIRYYKNNRTDAIKETMKAIRTDDRQLAEADYNFRARAFPDDGKPTSEGNPAGNRRTGQRKSQSQERHAATGDRSEFLAVSSHEPISCDALSGCTVRPELVEGLRYSFHRDANLKRIKS